MVGYILTSDFGLFSEDLGMILKFFPLDSGVWTHTPAISVLRSSLSMAIGWSEPLERSSIVCCMLIGSSVINLL
jgi:hypothetical protein